MESAERAKRLLLDSQLTLEAMDEQVEPVPAVPLSPPNAKLPEPLPDVTKVRLFARESDLLTG